MSEDPLIYLTMQNSKHLVGILRAVHFRNLATIFATHNGLKVTVEDSKCIQGNAFLHAGLFQDYKIGRDIVSFKTNLNVLIDCLSIFGIPNLSNETSLVLTYKSYGSTVDLLLEENGVVAECNIKTMEAFDILDFDFTGTLSDKIIVKSDCIREAFNELDMTSEVLELTLLPPPVSNSRLRLTTYGQSGTMHFDLPRTSTQVEVFEMNHVLDGSARTVRYRLSLLRPATARALSMASRVSMRINSRGFLSMQFMIKLVDGQVAFVEFFCVPDEDDLDTEADDDMHVTSLQPTAGATTGPSTSYAAFHLPSDSE